MFRTVLHSKIHLAKVTDCRLDYEGSLSLDEDLIEAAGMAPYEQVHVSNLNNGERFITYLIPGPRGSRTVMLNGPTARLGMPGDRIVIFSYKLIEEEKIRDHRPKILILDGDNNIVKEL
ncbi:MAG: aspartate 1-decarboxylase [Nitrospirae bacterium]|nr:MAG: aspartate 1-decarboxylase [Nitrospirota bacterium]